MIVKDLYVWEPLIREWVRIAVDAANCDFLGQREAYQREGICTMVVTRHVPPKVEPSVNLNSSYPY